MKDNKAANAKNIMLYVILLCLLAILAFYLLVYQKMTEKTETLKRENATLKTRVAELSKYYENHEMYETSIKDMEEEIDRIFTPYPADVKEEDALVLAYDMYNAAEFKYKAISLGSREALRTIEQDVVEAAGLEKYKNAIIFATRTASYTDVIDYYNLKDTIKAIADNAKKGTINNITYVYSESENALEGTVSYTFDFVKGIDGKVYEPVPTFKYKAGVEDIFKIPVEEETEEGNTNNEETVSQ